MYNEFNNNDVPIFLISLKAGDTRLNLVGADDFAIKKDINMEL